MSVMVAGACCSVESTLAGAAAAAAARRCTGLPPEPQAAHLLAQPPPLRLYHIMPAFCGQQQASLALPGCSACIARKSAAAQIFRS